MYNPKIPYGTWLDKLVESPGYQSFMKRLLIMGSVVALCGLVGKFLFHVESMGVFMIVGFGTLATIFFLKAYEHPKSLSDDWDDTENQSLRPVGFWASTAFANFSQKLFGWGLAVLIVGLLFFLEHWPGWQSMLIIGIPSGVLGVILKLIGNNARNNNRM